ncbi:unnamed protein product, partial [Didymodactylos carnosus]
MKHRRNTGIRNYVNLNGVKILESILVSYYKKSASIVENRSVMDFMIDSVLYLASEMMALRDHDAKHEQKPGPKYAWGWYYVNIPSDNKSQELSNIADAMRGEALPVVLAI